MSGGPVLVLGGRSDIGLAIARRFAAEGHDIQLAAREPDVLEMDKGDIELRHRVAVTLHRFDALDTEGYEAFVEGLPVLPQIVVSAVGLLGEQRQSEREPAQAVRVMRSNYEGPAAVLGVFAERFAERGSGGIIGVSSVAGDRGRASNYVYGAAKAGFTAFLSGLRHRLFKRGIHVLTVKPGFVRTRMTRDMELPAKLTATPEEVAEAVHSAWRRKRNTVYVKPVWQLIMLIIRCLPEGVFKRTGL
jgi:short-subunit dehydrogenase